MRPVEAHGRTCGGAAGGSSALAPTRGKDPARGVRRRVPIANGRPLDCRKLRTRHVKRCFGRKVVCEADPRFTSSFRDAKSLNQQILSCWSSSQVFSLWQAWRDHFNDVNIVTAYYTLAKVCLNRHECKNVLARLESSELAEALIEVLPHCGCQSIANITFAMAKLGHGDRKLAAKIVTIVKRGLSKGIFAGAPIRANKKGGGIRTQFYAREVASILTSIAKMQHVFTAEDVREVFGMASDSIQWMVHAEQFTELRPRVLVNLSWSFATVNDVYRNPAIMDVLATAAAYTLRTEDLACDLSVELGMPSDRYFSPQGLANLAWSFAKVSHNSWDQKDPVPLDMTDGWAGCSGPYKELYHLLGNVVAQQLTFLKKNAAEGRAIPRGQWKPIDFAHLAWSFARVGHRHPDMYPVLVETALESSRTGHTFIDQFDERSLAMFAWGNNAAVGCYSSTFFDTVAARYLNLLSESALKDCNVSIDSASMILGAFAASSHFSRELFIQVADFLRSMLEMEVQASPEFLSRISLSYAVVGLHAQDGSRRGRMVKALFEVIGDSFNKRVWEFAPGALASIGWSFAIMGLLEEDWGHRQREFFQHWRAAVAVLSHERGAFSTESLSKVYQTELVVRMHIPELYTGADIAESAFLTSYLEGLYQAGAVVNLSQQAWSKGLLYGPRHMTYFHTDVAEVLSSMEIPFLVEVDGGALLPSGEDDILDLPLPLPYSVDLAIVIPGIPPVAVEVDGPAHFTRNCTPPLPLGRTLLKHEVLRKLGWKVVSVPFFVWDHLPVREEKAAYLRHHLEHVLGVRIGDVVAAARSGASHPHDSFGHVTAPKEETKPSSDAVEDVHGTCASSTDGLPREVFQDRLERLDALRSRRGAVPLDALRRAAIRRGLSPPSSTDS